MSKKVITKILIGIFVLITISLAGYFYYQYSKVQSGLGVIEDQNPIAGGRVELQLENKRDYEISEMQLLYGYEENELISQKINSNGNNFLIDTQPSQSTLYYSFRVQIDNEYYNYPEKGSFKIDLSGQSTSDPAIDHQLLELGDIVSGGTLELELDLDQDFSTKSIELNYQINQQEEESVLLEYNDGYNFQLDLPDRVTVFSYQYSLQVLDEEILKYPPEKVIIKNTAVDDLVSRIESIANSENDKIHFSFADQYGNFISYKGEEEIGSLSTIKVLVMIEVYNQLEQGKIKMSDKVSRFGYSGTVNTALKEMMHESNNEATGALIKHVGNVDPINQTIQNYLGEDIVTYIDHTPAYAGLDGDRFDQFNVINTNELMRIFELLHRGEIVSKSASEEMIELMEGCEDYFDVLSLKGIDKISMKTGYYPPTMFGLGGVVTTEDNEEYYFGIFIDNWESGNRTRKEVLRKVLNEINQFVLDV